MRRLRLLGSLTAPVVLAGTFGCTATVVEASPDGGPATTTAALVVLERTERGDKPAQTYVSAKFLRAPVASDPDVVERIVGSDLALPNEGECQIIHASDAAADAQATTGPVELFDVGDVTIRTGKSAIPLAARAFPDVGDLVSGVFYTSPDTESELPSPGKYVFEGSGSPTVEGFAVETDAPPAPASVTVAGRPLADGIDLAATDALEITWGGSVTRDDTVYLEIMTDSGVAARCAFDDTGRGALPAAVLRDLSRSLPRDSAQPNEGATLALHRVRQGVFVVPGIDLGEVRFDMSVAASVTLSLSP